MKVAVLAGNGKVGRLVVEELSNRKIGCTVFSRGEVNKTVASKYISKSIFDLSKDDLQDFDVVVSAFGTLEEDKFHQIPDSIKYLSKILRNTKTRLFVVGGAGSLYVDKDQTLKLFDTPDFPESFKKLAKAHGLGLNYLLDQKDVNWTYFSPAADFRADGPRTGSYKLGRRNLTLNSNGESVGSYADFAIAIVDEAINNQHNQEWISVVSK